MVRRPRFQVAGGIYYIVQTGVAERPLFTNATHIDALESLLAAALRRTGTTALAYCWLPHQLHLCLRVQDVPPGRVIQGATSTYARKIHAHTENSGNLFAQRHRALLIDPEQWLLPLLSYLHWLPASLNRSDVPGKYPYTSHDCYTDKRSCAWLKPAMALSLLDATGLGLATDAYRHLMKHPPTIEQCQRLQSGNDDDPRVLGDVSFVDALPRRGRNVRSHTSLDRIIDMVALRLGLDRAQILSRSRQRALSQARAVIAWHATERGIITLTEVARRFRRDPSTLSIAIQRHRQISPELFESDALRYVVPIS